jgi:hypothetical protein
MSKTTSECIKTSDGTFWTRIVDVLNEVFNCGYDDYQSASWFPNGRDGKKVAWFPKLSNGKNPLAKEWDNYFYDQKNNFICQRRILTKEEDTMVCHGNLSHYNNPLSDGSVPIFSPECQIANYKTKIHGKNWHSKEIAVFAKVNKSFKFYGIYEFIGVQTVSFEKITRNNNCEYIVKDKYIEVFKRISEELINSEWRKFKLKYI